MRLFAGAVTGIATAAAVLIPTAAQAAAPYTAFTVNGAPNSYVLPGGSRVFDATNSTIALQSYTEGGMRLSASASGNSWGMSIIPPTGAQFAVGTRYDASWPADGSHAGLNLGGEGRGCGTADGWITIKELVRDTDTNAVTSFAASYGLRCDTALAANTGEIRYNSTLGYSGVTLNPDSLSYGYSELTPDGPQKTVTVTAGGSDSTTFDQAQLIGAHPRDFAVVTDGCAGKTLNPGQTCSVTVKTTPRQTGSRTASVLLPTGDGAGPTISLHVEGFIGAVGTYYPRTPARLMDTRNGTGVRKGVLGKQSTVSLQVTGRGGVPSTGVSAVVLNVTVTSPTWASYLTAYPTGQSRPTASNLNYPKGWTGANSVTVPVGAGGKVDFYNHSGSTHVIADVVGFYAGSSSVMSSLGTGNELIRTVPSRLMDTRTDGDGKLPGGYWIRQAVDYGEWNSFIQAFAVNITAVSPGGHGYLSAWNGAGDPPNTSTLNFSPGTTVPNMAIVPVQTCYESWCYGMPMYGVYNGSNAGTHIVVDIVGFFETRSDVSGLRFKPIKPTRIADSRIAQGLPGAVGAGVTATVTTPSTIAGPDTLGLSLNVTAVSPTANTYVTVWPAGVSGIGRPGVSSLNPSKGQIVPNAVITGIGPEDAFHVYNNMGSTHILVDVAGTYDLPWGSGTAIGAGLRPGTQAPTLGTTTVSRRSGP
ncbi:choice-of-anchor D domain-containing protein [Micromonospora sp. CPCC 206061]|uniref:choice-of-anchor D domain-containing protein n=1 Tax=Micromonospora sp. CPCC 206061 TaxID=3122410 RepID=UPI002FF3E02F